MATLQHFEASSQTPYVNLTVEDDLTESEYFQISDLLRDESKETILRVVIFADNTQFVIEQA